MHTTAEHLHQQALALLSRTPPNHAAAVPLLRRAADSGHSEAAFQLAGCLMSAGAARECAAAVGYLQQAARAGHVYARYNLLQLREAGGTEIAVLLPHYADLAAQGLAEAQLRLMKAYHAAGNAAQAVAYAQQAAAQNCEQAQYFLAQYHQNAAEPDLAQAHAFYRQAAAQGMVAAHWQLGLQYKLGQGVAQDWVQAEQHLTIAAEHGLAAAQTALAEMLLPHAPQVAVKWFQTASQQGDAAAHAALAEMYLLGNAVERNPTAARQHAEAAAQSRHPDALRLLGDIYRYGLGVAADAARAQAFYREAADLGNLAAHRKLLSDSALQGGAAYEAAKQSVLQRQQAEILYQQALAAHYGVQRSQDYVAALPLYRQAAQLGHRRAQTNLGMMYYTGQGVAANVGEAAQWFAAAAEQGESVAQYNLACLYFHGAGVAKNVRIACLWLEKAIECGHEQGADLRDLLAQWQKAV